MDTKSKSIIGIKNCFGCGICVKSCGRKIIELKENEKGFYEPSISNPELCINCGICTKVCSYSHSDISLDKINIKTYAAWSNNPSVRKECSSGGVGYEIAKYGIINGYKIAGVRYNSSKNRAEHFVAETIEDLELTKGSKYIQSFTQEALLQLEKSEKYIVFGTPCQIDSFRRFIKLFHCEQNYILVDFLCHGVPSMRLWRKYINDVSKQVGSIIDVKWRNKDYGWHESWNMKIKGDSGTYSKRWTKQDLFYELYLGNHCLGPQCYDACRFKLFNSSADIRIGDLWGHSYNGNNDGVSAVISFTDQGDQLIESVNCFFEEIKKETACEGQIAKPVTRSLQYDLVERMLDNDNDTINDIFKAVKKNQLKHKLYKYLSNPSYIIKRIIK